MGTLLDPPAVARAGWQVRRSGRKLADEACRGALERARVGADDIDLLLNTGIYHDRIMGEPAMAALIQEDVGINPEDPGENGHGTFSFDVANGGCGVLSALQVADGFLRSGTIGHALVVASDADPGGGMAPGFPFVASGAAVVCHWDGGPGGLVGFRWESSAVDDDDRSRSRVVFERGRNLLHIEQDPEFGSRAATLAGKAVAAHLADHGMGPADVDLVVANPQTPAFIEGLSVHTGIAADRIISVPGAEHVHTAAPLMVLAAADEQGRLGQAHRVLLVSAGAGIVVGAALLLR